VGEGSKATLANAPNADILTEIIEKLRERIEKGRAIFLVKVKSHRGDPPVNKRADTLADEGRLIEDKEAMRTKRARRLVFSSREEGDSRSSTWT
jgi:ribonuclease HI